MGSRERRPGVGACGAVYPVIPLAKAQRTPRTQREEKWFNINKKEGL